MNEITQKIDKISLKIFAAYGAYSLGCRVASAIYFYANCREVDRDIFNALCVYDSFVVLGGLIILGMFQRYRNNL